MNSMTPPVRVRCPHCHKVSNFTYSSESGPGQYCYYDCDGQETSDWGFVRYDAGCPVCDEYFEFTLQYKRVPQSIEVGNGKDLHICKISASNRMGECVRCECIGHRKAEKQASGKKYLPVKASKPSKSFISEAENVLQVISSYGDYNIGMDAIDFYDGDRNDERHRDEYRCIEDYIFVQYLDESGRSAESLSPDQLEYINNRCREIAGKVYRGYSAERARKQSSSKCIRRKDGEKRRIFHRRKD